MNNVSARDVIVNAFFTKGEGKLDGFSTTDRQQALERTDIILSDLDAAGYMLIPKNPTQAMISVLYKSRHEQIQPYEGVDCWAEHVIQKLDAAARET
jgi:hypothetical protein